MRTGGGHPCGAGMDEQREQCERSCCQEVVSPGREDLADEYPGAAAFGKQQQREGFVVGVETRTAKRCGTKGRKSGEEKGWLTLEAVEETLGIVNE